MVKTRRRPFGLFQLRHGRGHVAPVPRPAVDIAKVAAGAARGDGAGGRTRTACRITEAGSSSTSNITDAYYGWAPSALGRAPRPDAASKRVPTTWLPRSGLPTSWLPAELSSSKFTVAARRAGLSTTAWLPAAGRVPRRSVRAASGAGAGAGAFSETFAVARAVAAAATKGGLM